MARYTIDREADALMVRIAETEGDRDRLLAAFDDCRQGSCGCPTNEYDKLDEMSVDAGEDVVALVQKEGLALDPGAIEACVLYTLEDS